MASASPLAVIVLAVVACGGVPEVASSPAASRPAPVAAAASAAPVGSTAALPPATEKPATSASEPPDPPRGGPSAGLNLHAQRLLETPDGSLAAQGSGTPPVWPEGPTVELGRGASLPAVPGAEAVVRAMIPGFRRCYARALERDPNLAGAVGFDAKLGPTGEIVGVKTSAGTSLPPELVSCISAVLKAAQFAPPPGGSATLVMPISLTRQALAPPGKR